jgi:CheW-like protein
MSLRGRHVTASVAPTCRLLIVTVGGVCLALHADDVKGLLTVDEAGPLQTVMVQELAYPHMNVAARLGLAQDVPGPETRVILLGKGLKRANIHAAQVHGLKELEQSQMLPLPRQFHGEERNWYQGLVLSEERAALVLNPAWIMEGTDSNRIPATGEQPGTQLRTMPRVLAGGQV